MSDAAAEPEELEPKKSLKKPLILGLVLAIAGAGGGYVGYGFLQPKPVVDPVAMVKDVSEISFVPIEQMVISLGRASDNRYLRFSAQLEVPKYLEADVSSMMPRILDVLNGYLRAVRLEDVQDPAALIRMRAQMLRRVQTVVGDDAVRDFLVTEFVVS